MAQWIEHWPANQRVAGSIPSQDTCLGCGPGPQVGAHERQPHTDVSLPLLAGSIPSQDTCLGCGPGPQEGAHERQPHTDVSLPLFL